MHYGHRSCLIESGWYDVNIKAETSLGLRLNIYNLNDFFTIACPKFEKWYEEFHKHWTGVRGKQSEETSQEQEFKALIRNLNG